MNNPIQKAVDAAGSCAALARFLGFRSSTTVRKWLAAGCFPRTEWTGETDYAERIAKKYGLKVSQLKIRPLASVGVARKGDCV